MFSVNSSPKLPESSAPTEATARNPVAEDRTALLVHRFARDHFEAFDTASKTGNSAYFYECCLSFGTKSVHRTLNHPKTETLTFIKFKKQHLVTDMLSFEKTLLQLISKLPAPFDRLVPTVNTNHTEVLTLGKRGTGKQDQSEEIEDLKDEVHHAQFMEKHRSEALRFAMKYQSQLEKKLNKLSYFLRFNGIEPDLLLEAKSADTDSNLKQHAPKGLAWPQCLPDYPTMGAYHPAFKQTSLMIDTWKLRDGQFTEWLESIDPKEAQRLEDLEEQGLPGEKYFTPEVPRVRGSDLLPSEASNAEESSLNFKADP